MANREIKFRQFYDGGVHYWGYEHLSESKNPVFIGPVLGQRGFIESQQYTGLKDANGVEIYEGDIVSWDGDVCYIAYEASDSSFMTVEQYDSWAESGWGWSGNCTVIGNIYQNQELLNG